MRGQMITDPELLDRWHKVVGLELDLKQLRLIPYMVYVWTNNQKIEYDKISKEEFHILSLWVGQGLMIWNGRTRPKKEFWDVCNEVLYQSYVIYEEK